MALVDVYYEQYKCPHCNGFIQIRQQFDRDGCESHTIQHIDINGKETELTTYNILSTPKSPSPNHKEKFNETRS